MSWNPWSLKLKQEIPEIFPVVCNGSNYVETILVFVLNYGGKNVLLHNILTAPTNAVVVFMSYIKNSLFVSLTIIIAHTTPDTLHIHPGNLVSVSLEIPGLFVCLSVCVWVCALPTRLLHHAHLHVLSLEILHSLQGLLWVHLFIYCLHGLETLTRDISRISLDMWGWNNRCSCSWMLQQSKFFRFFSLSAYALPPLSWWNFNTMKGVVLHFLHKNYTTTQITTTK